MLERLHSGRPFEALHGPIFSIAVEETVTKFPAELEKDKVALRCHAAISLALKKAVERGETPQLRFRGRYDNGAELVAIQMGREVFPMVVARLDWDNTAIEIFPPLAAREFDEGEAEKKGIG